MHATVERLDDPRQKARAEHQLQALRRRAYWEIVCLLVNPVYFAYRVKCTLDGRFGLSTLDLIIAWVFLSLELSLTCKPNHVQPCW